MISKVFIILILLCLWGYVTKTDRKAFFQISAHAILCLAKLKESGKSFLEEAGKADAGWGYPKKHLNFTRLKKFLLLCNLTNPTPSFAVF